MKKVLIPKKTKGEYREIMIPSLEEKIVFQNMLPRLNKKAKTLCLDNVHGFLLGKSPITNAKAHIGYNYTLSFDIKDFFDNVTPSHVANKLSKDEIKTCMPDGRAYQGLPSSPLVANIAGVDMDAAIARRIAKIGNIKYTRYADDLSFSFNDYSIVQKLKAEIPGIVGTCGFKINKTKTRLQDERFGNRVITGVSVGSSAIQATRKIRRKLRAARHQNNSLQIHGLNEWVKLKEPVLNKTNNLCQREVDKLTKVWKLNRIQRWEIPQKQSEDLGDDVIISGDFVYILGLSNFGTNWKSCLQHPRGGSHSGAVFFALLAGARVALLLSNEEVTISGFTRRKAKARVLVFDTESGERVYGRLYGESEAAKELLKKKLEANNIYIASLKKGLNIRGRVLAKSVRKVYLDYCSKFSVTIDNKEYIKIKT